jgi:YhcH/YjgK/YiaL family protein
MFFNVVEGETKLLADQKPEFHRQYLDIHLVLEGKEVIGAGVLGLPLPLSEPFNEAHDLGFSPAIPGETLIHLQPGELAVIFPGELHRPMSTCTAPAALRKIVAKIDCALLT